MSQFPNYTVYEVARGDFLHNAGYALGWYFETEYDTRGPYRAEAVARRACARLRGGKRARRRAQITELAYLSEEGAVKAMKSLRVSKQERELVMKLRARLQQPQVLPKGARGVRMPRV